MNRVLLSVLISLVAISTASAQNAAKPPLRAADIGDIARLVMLEDHRQFDSTELARLLASSHPEVRRRAAVAVGRINDKRGVALLLARPLDRDTAVAATTVFAVGQLRDTLTIPWLDSLMTGARTAPTVAGEAAIALGKIKTAAAREVLARFLSQGTVGLRETPALREALLSIGRSTARGDLAPITRWTRSAKAEMRWRATWALFRGGTRDPVAVPALIMMAKDQSALVRSWAVRGLTKAQADSANVGARAEDQLLIATRDKDRRVKTEALRALGTYTDSAAIATLVAALGSPDTWISVSAAEGLGRIRNPATIPQLVAATSARRPCAIRVVAMQQMNPFAPTEAIAAALDIITDSVAYCRSIAAQTLARATTGPAGDTLAPDRRAAIDRALSTFRDARRADLASTDLPSRVAGIRAIGTYGDLTDLPALMNLRSSGDSLSAVMINVTAAAAAIQRRASNPTATGRGGGGGGRGAPPRGNKALEEYRAIVDRWVVPDYNGAPRPTARWQTPKGTFELELYPGDAPLAVDDFVRTMDNGSMIGTEFTRVVPDFVNQQQTIRTGNTLRDEVNRKGLTRANLAWATGGLDTGSPGYTLGHTPQPHNEGDFTSLGRVTRGMDVVDHTDIGDRIIAARMLTGVKKP